MLLLFINIGDNCVYRCLMDIVAYIENSLAKEFM